MRWPGLVPLLASLASGTVLAHPAADWYDALVEADLKRPAANFVRAAAMFQAAMFDAANAVEPRFRPYRPTPAFDRPTSAPAAAHAAAHAVLREMYPDSREVLDRRLAEALNGSDAGTESGRLLGLAVAQRILAERARDGWDVAEGYRPHTTPGMYVPTTIPTAPWTAAARPFVLSEPAALRPPPPYRLHEAEWARDFNEVKLAGGMASERRTAEQARRARFIAISHPRFYGQAVARAVREQAPALVDGCRTMAAYAVATADAFLASFEAKYHYAFWRPITAIRNADIDGNDDTARDPSWSSLVDLPMHPEYPCQHCVTASIAATVLLATPGMRTATLVLRNPAFPEPLAVPIGELVAVTAEARIHGGLHYRASTEAGAALGRRVAERVLRELEPLQ